jgi:hypothetical protein
MTETTAATPIQTKAAKIGRYWTLLNYAEARARRERERRARRGEGPKVLETVKALDAVACQAGDRACAIEDSLAGERPTTRVDALILAGWARHIARMIQADADPADEHRTQEAGALVQIVHRLVRFLEADTGNEPRGAGAQGVAHSERSARRSR